MKLDLRAKIENPNILLYVPQLYKSLESGNGTKI